MDLGGMYVPVEPAIFTMQGLMPIGGRCEESRVFQSLRPRGDGDGVDEKATMKKVNGKCEG